ncbi:MAG: ABC transporter permease [Oscillospiraceae bacterium]|nr:ABC transporter permease [Oscillospiraceae bacterium]
MSKIRRILTSSGGMNALSSVMAVLVGLLAGFIILLISNPSNAVAGFITVMTGGFSDMFNVGMVLYYATPIIMTGLSVGFAMKTGLFNIGASGQFTFGMYASILAAIHLSFLPDLLRCFAALLSGMLAGAIWGSLPGILKAFRNVHEVISCIMMNYIGMYVVNYLIGVTGIYDQFRNMTTRVPTAANLPSLGLDEVFSTATAHGSVRNSSVGSGIVIAVAICIILYIVLEKTKFGYELKSCGYNRDAARYAGINENRGVILSMTIAGGLAGLGGALLTLAGAGRGIAVVDVLAVEGFHGIPIALLGLSNPIGIIFSGSLVAYLTQSGFLLQQHGYAPEVIDIIVAVIIYFSALALLLKGFIQYFLREKKAADTDIAGTIEENNGESPGDASFEDDSESGSFNGSKGGDI